MICLTIARPKPQIAGTSFSYVKNALSLARDGLNPQYNLGGTPAGNNYNPARTISAGLNLTF